MRHKVCAIVLLIFLVMFTNSALGAELQVSAQSAILMDADTGKILYSKNPHERRPPASTTKILTAILAIEKGKLNDVTEITARAAQTGESRINLVTGEKITLENLLYGALLKSGNDACVAIAECIAPSVEEFVNLMNLKARMLGCYNSNFCNTNGLPHKDHYSSAYDLALLARYALSNRTFAKIVATPDYTIQWEENGRKRKVTNTNKLLQVYPGATGIKTGTTVKAGQCLVASATRENRNLLAVLLKSNNRFADAQYLLNYGFNNYRNINIVQANKAITYHDPEADLDLALATERGMTITIKNNEALNLTSQIVINRPLGEDLKKNQSVGNIIFFNNGIKVGEVALYALKDYKLNKTKSFINFSQIFGGMNKIN
ncbi:MAG: D-alanyl-D-alanine carboxypeptidase family protein [Peptococcaceae bacterium]